MQTGIAIHDTDQKKGNAMKHKLNHGGSRKKKTNATVKAMSLAVLVALNMTVTAWAAEPSKSEPGGWVNLALGCPVAVKTPTKAEPQQGKGGFAASDLFKEKFADKAAGIVGWGSSATPVLYVNPGIEELSLLKGAIKVPARARRVLGAAAFLPLAQHQF